jgi:predicted RNA-binding Zn-ribbon protein involved in translation (DUF1610 family)
VKFDPETGKPHWAPRVRMEKLRRLYLNDAAGILDEELLDDVGTTLYCRCESILDASDAARGKIHCPSCANIILRASASLEETILCAKCGWTIRWADYQASYQHRDLWGGGFADAMREFTARWERAVNPREKMILIDRLIHVWHWQFSDERSATRHAAPTFIEGSRKRVIQFLDQLTNR